MKITTLLFALLLVNNISQAQNHNALQALTTRNSAEELQTVTFVDPLQYIGRWYQIARNPLPFEPLTCMCAQQTLTLLASGSVGVYNSCNADSVDGPLNDIRGEAVIIDPSNSKLTVDFGFPQKGQYWIIGLASDYSWAVVSDPSRRSLYILSKTPELDPQSYTSAIDSVKHQIDITKLLSTNHKGCSYPAL